MAGLTNGTAYTFTPAASPTSVLYGELEELDGLDFDVRYRGHWWINLRLTPKLLRVFLAASDAPPARIGVKGVVVEIRPGTSHEFRLS